MSVNQKINKLIEEVTKAKEETSPLALGAAVTGGGLLAAKKIGLLKAGAALKNAAVLGKIAKAGGGASYVDPSKSRADAAKQSALYSGIGTTLVNAPSLISGNLPGAVFGIGSGLAAAKGGALGAALGGGRDTLLKSAAIPAATVAAAAPLSNMAFDAAGYDNYEVNPGLSAAITAGAGGIGWLLRNRENKNKQYA